MEKIHGHLSNGKAIYGFQLQGESLRMRMLSLSLDPLQHHDLTLCGQSREGYSNKNGKGFGLEKPTKKEMQELINWARQNLQLLK